MKKKKHAEDQLELDNRFGTAAFPESPSGGGTMRGATGLTTQGNRDRGRSGHFPIPRFDSIRGRFDSGIFASNATGQTNGGGVAVSHTVSGEDIGKVTAEQTRVATALSTPSGSSHPTNGNNNGVSTSGSYKAPRSSVIDDRLLGQGFTATDVGRPVSGTSSRKGSGTSSGGGGAAGRQDAGWGLAMSGEYPDLEGSSDPYAVDNAMAETGTAARGSNT